MNAAEITRLHFNLGKKVEESESKGSYFLESRELKLEARGFFLHSSIHELRPEHQL